MWIICEGLDRTGKSTIAEFYKKQGFEVVHMMAPDKKYMKEGYSGPSYFEETVDALTQYQGKNVFFDRSIYGELVWPRVYNRKPQLTEEDIEYIRLMEKDNDTLYIVMHDPNTEAHWRRCVANKESLTKDQFNLSNSLFKILASTYNFNLKTLPEFNAENQLASPAQVQSEPELVKQNEPKISSEQEKLLRANAINDLLNMKLIPKEGKFYDQLEAELKSYLNNKLGEIFGKSTSTLAFDKDDIEILKVMCQQLRNKTKK